MPEPISKITKGTVGSLPCEISLNKILLELNDARVTKKVLGRYDKYKSDLKNLRPLDKKIWEVAMKLFKKHHMEQVDKLTLPTIDLATHLKCCMTAQYRIELELFDSKLG